MLKPKEEIVWRKKKEVMVLLNTKTGHYYTLNEVASFLWLSMFANEKSFDEAIDEIRGNFENPPEKASLQNDCTELIEQWKKENLIEEK